MKYLFDHWNKVEKKFENSYIMLFLDCDGTLAPIAESPEKARIPADVKKLLKKVSGDPSCKVAIISGRSLEDIKRLVGVNGLIYSGNHGLEIEGPGIKFKPLSLMGVKSVSKYIGNKLRHRLSPIKGVLIEDKGLSLSVHYRMAERKDEARIKALFFGAVRAHIIKKEITVMLGKKVFEVRPRIKWDKGKAALWLFARQKFLLKNKPVLPVYMGDDVTDEDAFKALRGKGITVSVGRQPLSQAEYYIKDTGESKKVIRKILKLKKGSI